MIKEVNISYESCIDGVRTYTLEINSRIYKGLIMEEVMNILSDHEKENEK